MDDLFSYKRGYPFTPGFKDRTTSHDAAVKMAESGASARYEKLVYEALLAGPATAKELAIRISAHLDNVRPRLTALRMKGLIERTGERRNGQHVLRRLAIILIFLPLLSACCALNYPLVR